MGKSAAEKMREYRQRLKDNAEKYEAYLTKAKQRKKRNYVPVNQLSSTEKKRRREKNRNDVRAHRIKKRIERVEIPQPCTSLSKSGYETPESADRLIVNMSFPNRRNEPRKRVQRALSKKNREYKELKLMFENIRKKYRTNLRRLQRIKKKQRNETQQGQIQNEKQ